MRMILGLGVLALLSAAPTVSQAQPRGSYERQCTNIRMEGPFLHATCRGPNGPAVSSINVASCSTDIFVGPDGGLACVGPGGGAPPSVRDAPPGYAVGPDRGYDRDRGDRRWRRDDVVTLSTERNYAGRPFRVDGPEPNLNRTGLNDRVRSIRLERGSGPWVICTDANYRGRCMTIERSVKDTRRIGMGDAISSLRPLR
ncbi:beta/gamma crystallin-related protein [uncultured Phenylobacterium sp.]|uniref:beta/gamma crystallin-related protein n=1 Tax=uncultured Phenylobacterium sp. TaxID=349273 RepID=UPI0025D73A5D|nr:beta/gamma crystallin-related protein [uncultured Phenylobacterium sp.]